MNKFYSLVILMIISSVSTYTHASQHLPNDKEFDNALGDDHKICEWGGKMADIDIPYHNSQSAIHVTTDVLNPKRSTSTVSTLTRLPVNNIKHLKAYKLLYHAGVVDPNFEEITAVDKTLDLLEATIDQIKKIRNLNTSTTSK